MRGPTCQSRGRNEASTRADRTARSFGRRPRLARSKFASAYSVRRRLPHEFDGGRAARSLREHHHAQANKLLETDIRDEFGWDPVLDATRIVVNVHDGKVTLTGVVPMYGETVLGYEGTSRVGGVTAVDNRISVDSIGGTIADEDILADCVIALDNDRSVPRGFGEYGRDRRTGNSERRGSSLLPADRRGALCPTRGWSCRVDGPHHPHFRTARRS